MINSKNWETHLSQYSEPKREISADYMLFIRDKSKHLFLTSQLFLKLVSYNTRGGLKLKSLNTYLRLVQIFFKISKVIAQRRRRRTRRFINLSEFEFMFQQSVRLKQLLLTKKLVRKRGRHKKFDYKFLPLYKNKQINQLMYWLRMLSYKYSSRKYITRLVYVYYDFLFLKKYSYVVRLHKSLRMDFFFKKKKKFENIKHLKRRPYLGKLLNL